MQSCCADRCMYTSGRHIHSRVCPDMSVMISVLLFQEKPLRDSQKWVDDEETQRLQRLAETLSQEAEALKRESLLLSSAPGRWRHPSQPAWIPAVLNQRGHERRFPHFYCQWWRCSHKHVIHHDVKWTFVCDSLNNMVGITKKTLLFIHKQLLALMLVKVVKGTCFGFVPCRQSMLVQN